MAKERIGVMGGTFDPIHTGHIRMALESRRAAKLDQVLVMPSGCPPHKQDVSPAEDRWRMVCAACANDPALTPSRMEIDREGPTFTVDTLSLLREKYPKAELFYIIGTDALMEMHRWREIDRALSLCTFLVCPRVTAHSPAAQAEQLKALTQRGGRFQHVDMEVVEAASSDIRAALSRGEATPALPVTVREYCAVMGLYGLRALSPRMPEWMTLLFRDLSRKRFSHTLAVAGTARSLAAVHGVDPDQAEIAGLLHDCAKCLPLEEMQRLAREHRLTDDPAVLATGRLLHSVAGALLARTLYGLEDQAIIDAIARHTTGQPGMTKLDMVVFLADKIEPTRAGYPTLDRVRMLSYFSLEKAMIASMQGTADYVRDGGKALHPSTLETLSWLKSLPEAQ